MSFLNSSKFPYFIILILAGSILAKDLFPTAHVSVAATVCDKKQEAK